MKPAVLLISPGVIRPSDQDFGLPHLVSLGSVLQDRLKVRVEILDLGYEGGDHRALQRTLDELAPFLLIGVSVYSSFDYRRAMTLGRFLKERYPDVPLVGGGYHASALPGDVVFPGSPFDAVVVGEGEQLLQSMVEDLLGGRPVRPGVHGPGLVADLDTLPPMRWELLLRYQHNAISLGRKLQVVLARGCPYHCTFCMERAKTGYSWRAYSPERAIDELSRLAAFTDLSHWVVNVADPLFGFQRRWRREVLSAIPRAGLVPRQFWTLTRSDDLDDEDVLLFARARFSIGIGLESGSPRLLRVMQKGNHPDAYLGAIRGLAEKSRKYGLSWAANIIVGHPGETPESLRETHAFLRELYLSAPETCGWLSIDPFRLYPGAHVHEEMARYSERFGTRFHHPDWWRHWSDGPLRAQVVDPSAELDFETRVDFMYKAYAPLVAEVQRRFRGQGRDIDRVFRKSLDEQREQLSPASRDHLLRRAAELAHGPAPEAELSRPIGLQVRDPWVRRREEAVRRLLEAGVLRTARVIEALLEVGPERTMPAEAARRLLDDDPPPPEREGALPWGPGIGLLGLGLEALGLGPGDRAADLAARSGYVAALLSALVGEDGEVVVVGPGEIAGLPANTRMVTRPMAQPWVLPGTFDGLWLGLAAPRWPRDLQDALRDPGGRAILALGPRFRDQDLVVLTRAGAVLDERRLGRARLPVLGGRGGWVPAPELPAATPLLRVESWPGPAAAFAVFARLDLGQDAASCWDPGLPPVPWAAPLVEAWRAAPGRLAIVSLALGSRSVEALQAALLDPPPPLRDPAGRALARGFADALMLVDPGPPATASPDLLADLSHLRALLWERSAVPPLLVLHCAALGPAGRATTVGGERRIAVSLLEPHEHAVMQVLHEEMHALVDPHVRAEGRDTRAGTPGFAVHAELEATVLAATDAFLRARAPGWVGAYERWLGRLGAWRSSQPMTQRPNASSYGSA